jgi:hypothetical protein
LNLERLKLYIHNICFVSEIRLRKYMFFLQLKDMVFLYIISKLNMKKRLEIFLIVSKSLICSNNIRIVESTKDEYPKINATGSCWPLILSILLDFMRGGRLIYFCVRRGRLSSTISAKRQIYPLKTFV